MAFVLAAFGLPHARDMFVQTHRYEQMKHIGYKAPRVYI
jgi:hypothetical protein